MGDLIILSIWMLGAVGVLLVGLTFWGRVSRPLAQKINADFRLAHSLRRSRTDFSRTTTHLWRQLYDEVPELRDRALVALLGQDGVDAVVASVMQKYPVPAQVAPETPACSTAPDMVASVPEQKPKGYQTVTFKDGEPQTLAEYAGQPHITEYLAALVAGLGPRELVPREHQLFYCAAPGMGKTLLAKAYANTLNRRNEALGLPPVYFQEEFPADLGTLHALDEAVRRAGDRPATVIFIDEIHDLTDRHALKLYMLMEEGRYKYEGEPAPVDVPNVVLLGATTDFSRMHPALRRRFNRHMLEPMGRAQILHVISTRTFPIARDAAEAVVARTHFSGAPWEGLQLYGQARAFAKAAGRTQVELPDVTRVFASQRIDERGLRFVDRRVIEVLLAQPRYRRQKGSAEAMEFVCYGASESDVCALAQVDRGEYRDSVKPRLMSRGLLQVRATYGQALTPKAVQLYRTTQQVA